MRFQKPFTLIERQKALEVYRSYLHTYNQMRFEFPPLNEDHREIMRRFRRAMRDFSETLSQKDAKVRVDLLNDACRRADALGLAYSGFRNAR